MVKQAATLIRNFSLREEWGKNILLLGPLVAYLAVFFVYPLSSIVINSLFDPGLTFKHYLAMVKYPVYLQVFRNTFEISIGVTVLSILVGYPIAYVLSSSKSTWATILLIGVLFPFWVSILVRTYAWMIILGRYGVVNNILMGLGLTEAPLRLMFNRLGVYIGMVYAMIPYAVLPMLAVMLGIDRNLMRAADNLGSTPWQSFRNVFFPLSLSGVGAAFLLTFIRSMGFFITPALMGGRQDAMIATSIQTQVELLGNGGFGSALSIVLLIFVLVLFFIYTYFFGIDILWGGGGENRLRSTSAGPEEVVSTNQRIAVHIRKVLWSEDRRAAFEKMIWGCQDHLSEIQDFISRKSPKLVHRIPWDRIRPIVLSSLFLIFMIMPILIVVVISFSNDSYLRFPPHQWGLRLFLQYFSSEGWMRATLNSFQTAIQVMVLATFLGTLASLSLVRGNYRGKQYWYALILSPIIIPVIVSSISIYFLFAKLKLIGSILGLVLAHTVLAVPYVVIVMTAVLKGFDERLEQASMSLGAGRVRTFFNVTFPIIRPGVLTALLFAFIASFDELVGAMFICGVKSVTLPRRMWDGIRDEINPTIAAIAVLLIAFTLVLMLLAMALRHRQEQLYARKT